MRKGWIKCKIKDIAETVNGGTPSTKISEYWNGDIPWLTPKDLTNFKRIYIKKGSRNISKKGLKNSSAKLLPKGTILLTSRAPIGYIAIAKNEISTNQGFKNLIVDNKKANNLYIFYWLKNNIQYLKSLGTGTTFAELNKSTIENLEIEIPKSLDEQRAIASVLSSLDDKIDLLHRQNKTLEAMAEALFRKWFIEDAKEEWEEGVLGDIVDIKIGRTPPRKEFQWFSNNPNDVKWVSVKDLGENGVFIFDTSEFLTKSAIEKFNIPIIPENTVLLSFKMTVGRVGITTEPMVSNEAIAHFKLKDDTPITMEYLYFFLKLYKYQELGSTSTIVTSINSKMIKDFVMLIPDRESLLKFDSVAKICFEKIKQNQQQIRTLEQLRDTLLPKLMSGEVRVKY